ncbi:MAG: enoyl-CoA hydratase/isomerase family protein [Gemmatimonadaceae bacterium]|nr:enoyl-CoA hydratase/isomerase family protein [Gemmatimonadaceae bacterium]
MDNENRPGYNAVAGGTVSVDVSAGVGTITFGHPKGNSLPGALLQHLAGTITAVGQDPDVRVLVLRSEGSGPFCAGASFDELVRIADPDEGERFFSGFAAVILAMLRTPQFVLVRVHGRTAGGGIGIAAAGDYTVAVRSASAKLSELAVGIGPFVVGPVIARRIGMGPFMAMSVDADWRDADWCERHGLYARLFDDAAAMDAALAALATTLASSNPDAMRLMKGVAWQGTEDWPALLAERARLSGTLVLSDFTRHAIAAFRAK